MTVNISKPAINVAEKLAELNKPTGIAGEAMLRAETPQEQFNLIGAGRRNILINGAMEISQRATSFTSVDSTNLLTLDRWTIYENLGELTLSRDTDAPSGFRYSYKATVGTTDTLTSSSIVQISQIIEGYNTASLSWDGTSNSKPAVFSFWVKSSIAGIYAVRVRIPSVGTVIQNYNVDSANTWEYKTLTIPSCPYAITNTTNGSGLIVGWQLVAGSSYHATSGVWQTADDYGTAEMTNTFMSNSGATFQVTGAQFEVGKVATPFGYRSYGEELALCQRYYCKTYSDGTAVGTATSTGAVMSAAYTSISYASAGTWFFPVEMRTAPTTTIYSTANANTTGKVTADSTDGTGAVAYIGTNSAVIYRNNDNTGVGASVFVRAHATADAEL